MTEETLPAAKPSFKSGVVSALPVAVAGVAAGAAGIIVTVILARLLSNQGYGAYAQLVGLFLVISMPGSAVIVAVVRRTASWRAAGSHGELEKWAHRMHVRMYWFLGAFAILSLAVCIPVSSLLAKPSPISVAAMLLSAGVWILLCIDRGFLQGTQKYHSLAANYLVEGGVRTVLVLGLAVFFKLPGATIGVLLSEAVTAVHARWAANRSLSEPIDDGRSTTPPSVRRDLMIDLIAALGALALLAYLQNIDVVLLGRLNAGQAGAYAAVSVASKGLVFCAIVLGAYLLPEAAISHHEGDRAVRQLYATLAILAIPAVVLVSIAVVVPEQFLKLIFGARYLTADAAFAPLSIAMVFLSVTVIATMYLLAHGHRWVVFLLAPGAIAATFAVNAAHGNPTNTAKADLVVQGIVCGASVLSLIVAHRATKKEESHLLPEVTPR